MSAQQHALATEYLAHRGFASNGEKKYGIDPDDDVDWRLLRAYLMLEVRQVEMTVRYWMENEDLFHQSDRIPVVYGPDSATHVMEELRKWMPARCFPVDRNEAIPQTAWADARNCGAIVFCDSVINYGKVSADILRTLPPNIKGPDGPLKVITYFNYATHHEPCGRDTAPVGTERSVRGFDQLRRAVQGQGYEHHFYVNEIGDLTHDLFDRADAMARVAREDDSGMWPGLARRFLKPKEHHVPASLAAPDHVIEQILSERTQADARLDAQRRQHAIFALANFPGHPTIALLNNAPSRVRTDVVTRSLQYASKQGFTIAAAEDFIAVLGEFLKEHKLTYQLLTGRAGRARYASCNEQDASFAGLGVQSRRGPRPWQA